MSHRLEVLRNLRSFIIADHTTIQVLHLYLLLRIVDLDLLLTIINIQDSWILIILVCFRLLIRLVHALLYKLFSVQLLSYFNAELKMFRDKVL